MMAAVLLEAVLPASCEPALAPEPRDKPELLQRSEVGERGRRPDPKAGGNLLEARAPLLSLSCPDDPEGLDLTMGQLLKDFHGERIHRAYISVTLIIR
jgi:hypothetical protein